jgi:hypothetical protein
MNKYNCHICSKDCYLDDTNNNSYNKAVTYDGKVYCLPCNDIKDWDDIFGESKILKKKEEYEKKAPIESIGLKDGKESKKQLVSKKGTNNVAPNKVLQYAVYCRNCKISFTDKTCVCGFKNPLFR